MLGCVGNYKVDLVEGMAKGGIREETFNQSLGKGGILMGSCALLGHARGRKQQK